MKFNTISNCLYICYILYSLFFQKYILEKYIRISGILGYIKNIKEYLGIFENSWEYWVYLERKNI